MKQPIKKEHLFLLIGLIFAGMMGGCDSPLVANLFPNETTVNPAAAVLPTVTPPMTTATPQVDLNTLTVWVPPQFDPNNGSQAGNLLRSQIDIFEIENPGIKVLVRVKAVSGPASLLNSLELTSIAAPQGTPGIIALSRSDLETAALRGLIFPIEGVSNELNDTDWYDYARNLASFQRSILGLPFAGDSQILIFRPGRLGTKPSGWEGILKTGQPVAIPADDPRSLLTQAFYLSEGGKLQDEEGKPSLQEEPLTSTLIFLARGFQLGIFPEWTSTLENQQQVWQTFQDQKSQMAVVWISQYLAALPPDSDATTIFPLGESAVYPADGWVWALSDPYPERRAISMKLAESLVASDFLANWTSSAGYLPTRPSALAAWKNQTLQALANQVVMGAQIEPPNEIQAVIAPIFNDLTVNVIGNQADPVQTAKNAIELLAGTQEP